MCPRDPVRAPSCRSSRSDQSYPLGESQHRPRGRCLERSGSASVVGIRSLRKGVFHLSANRHCGWLRSRCGKPHHGQLGHFPLQAKVRDVAFDLKIMTAVLSRAPGEAVKLSNPLTELRRALNAAPSYIAIGSAVVRHASPKRSRTQINSSHAHP